MNIKSEHFQPVPKEQLASIGTEPVPAGPYYEPEFFELEREAIFKKSWIHIGHSCEVPEPGSFIVRPFEIANASILVTRTKDGDIRAFHNVCPHRGTQLVDEANGNRSRFSCPYHAWTFSNEGDLISAPDFERFYVEKDQCGLKEISADVCAGFLFINLDKSPSQSLSEFIGPLAKELEKTPHAKATTFAEYIYEVDANWKLTYDNFQENYHLRYIHPRSGEMAGGPENPFGYPEKYGFYGPHRTQTIWSNPNATPRPFQGFAYGKTAQSVMEDGVSMADAKEYYGIFPNLFLFGNPMTPFVQHIVPLAHNKTRSVIRLYWIGDDNSASKRFARESAMATALDIHSEDRAVIERGQMGLASGALSHIHFQSQEVLCRHLYNEVTTRVEAYKAERDAKGGAA